MKRINLFFMVLLGLSLIITSCTKEIPGPAGADGTDGTDGVANIENLNIIVSPSQWTYDNLYDIWYYKYNIEADNNSLVYGYVMSGNGKQALPYLTLTDYKSEQYSFATSLFETPASIELQYSNLEDFSVKPTNDVSFYFIIVPPVSVADESNVNYSDYDAVLKHYKLD